MEKRNKEKKIFTLNDLTNFISLAIGAGALIFSTWQYKIGTNKENMSNRPFISLYQQKISFTIEDSTSSPTFILGNYGVRPAYKCSYRIIEFEKIEKKGGISFLGEDNWATQNPFVPGVNIDFNSKPRKRIDSCEYFYKINLKYEDVISKTIYNDSLYYKWIYRKENLNKDANINILGLTIEESEELDKNY